MLISIFATCHSRGQKPNATAQTCLTQVVCLEIRVEHGNAGNRCMFWALPVLSRNRVSSSRLEYLSILYFTQALKHTFYRILPSKQWLSSVAQVMVREGWIAWCLRSTRVAHQWFCWYCTAVSSIPILESLSTERVTQHLFSNADVAKPEKLRQGSQIHH